MEQWFPNGVTAYLAGGAMIGAAVGAVFALTGRVAGISSILTAVQSLWSRRPVFHQPHLLEQRVWKGALVAGLLVGAALTGLASGWYVTTVQPWRLALGGLCVGFGTRMACGCTSGHGVCGISSGSRPSLVSTATFVGTAIVVANVCARLGVTP